MTDNLCGELELVFERKYGKTNVTLTNVLEIPGMSENLISVEELMSKGVECVFKSERVFLFEKGKEFGYGLARDDGLRILECTPVRLSKAMIGAEDKGIELWHEWLGHTASSSIKTMVAENLVEGIDLKEAVMQIVYIDCCEGLMTRGPFKGKIK